MGNFDHERKYLQKKLCKNTQKCFTTLYAVL